MSLKIYGIIEKIGELTARSSTFSTRDLVLKLDGQYPQLILFQVVQDRCSMLDQYKPGDKVHVHFDLRGNQHEGKYYNNLNCWKIEKT